MCRERERERESLRNYGAVYSGLIFFFHFCVLAGNHESAVKGLVFLVRLTVRHEGACDENVSEKIPLGMYRYIGELRMLVAGSYQF